MEPAVMNINLSVLDSSLYWSFTKIQYLYSLDQAKQLILEYMPLTEQVTIDLSFYLYNTLEKRIIYIISQPFHNF